MKSARAGQLAGGVGVFQPRLQHFDAGLAETDGGDDLGFGVGDVAGWQAGLEEKADFGFHLALGEFCGVEFGRAPEEAGGGHGCAIWRGGGAGGADLPAADGADFRSHQTLHRVGLGFALHRDPGRRGAGTDGQQFFGNVKFGHGSVSARIPRFSPGRRACARP